jgi:hypothetical protein
VLCIRKPDEDWPAGAVWNFPAGKRGQLRIRLQLPRGFAGAVVGITDHFSVAFDEQDVFHNVFNLHLLPLAQANRFQEGKWHDLTFNWDCDNQRLCTVLLDGQPVEKLTIKRETPGPSYLRLRSTAVGKDPAGFRVESVAVDVGASWM